MPVVAKRAKRPVHTAVCFSHWTCPQLHWWVSCNTHTQSFPPHYLLFALCLSESFSFRSIGVHVTKDLRAYSIREAFSLFGWRATQKENSKPSNLGGVKSDLNYSGRTGAMGKREWGWIQAARRWREEPKIFSYSHRFYYEDRQTRRLFSCKYASHCAGVSLCFQLSLACSPWIKGLDFGQACLKDSIVSPACTAWCRIYVTNTLLYKLVQQNVIIVTFFPFQDKLTNTKWFCIDRAWMF